MRVWETMAGILVIMRCMWRGVEVLGMRGPGDSCQANCGEGKLTEGSFKECDDGNLVGGNGSASCQIECTKFTHLVMSRYSSQKWSNCPCNTRSVLHHFNLSSPKVLA